MLLLACCGQGKRLASPWIFATEGLALVFAHCSRGRDLHSEQHRPKGEARDALRRNILCVGYGIFQFGFGNYWCVVSMVDVPLFSSICRPSNLVCSMLEIDIRRTLWLFSVHILPAETDAKGTVSERCHPFLGIAFVGPVLHIDRLSAARRGLRFLSWHAINGISGSAADGFSSLDVLDV